MLDQPREFFFRRATIPLRSLSDQSQTLQRQSRHVDCLYRPCLGIVESHEGLVCNVSLTPNLGALPTRPLLADRSHDLGAKRVQRDFV